MEEKLDDEKARQPALSRIDLVKMGLDSARMKIHKEWISDHPGGDIFMVESYGEFIPESKESWRVGLVTAFEIRNSAGKRVWGSTVGRRSPNTQPIAEGRFKNDAAALKSYLKSAFDET